MRAKKFIHTETAVTAELMTIDLCDNLCTRVAAMETDVISTIETHDSAIGDALLCVVRLCITELLSKSDVQF